MMSPDPKASPLDYSHLRPLVVLLGPTAVGKTRLAIQLAQDLSAEIVSADSRLLYIGMDIGTAKPSLFERSLVPHHLIDVTSPDHIWSLAQYQSAAVQAIASIHQRNRLPILVGGTGQYIHALTQGWEIPPAAPDLALRHALESWQDQIGFQALHDHLAHLDPVAASAIDPPNVRRTIRALEVILSTGRLFSAQKGRSAPPYNILICGITRPRPELYQRIDERIHQMVHSGLVDEVKHLLAQGYSPSLPTMSAIGYGEIAAYLRGEITLEQAVEQIKRRTRIFVRRQTNWFKPGDPSIQWFSAADDTLSRIEQVIRQWLNNISDPLVPKS